MQYTFHLVTFSIGVLNVNQKCIGETGVGAQNHTTTTNTTVRTGRPMENERMDIFG